MRSTVSGILSPPLHACRLKLIFISILTTDSREKDGMIVADLIEYIPIRHVINSKAPVTCNVYE